MYQYRATILKVIDGDTVDADVDLGFDIHVKTRLRLFGINAPETRGGDKESGDAARDYLQLLISDREVVLETQKDKREKYGRYLATILFDGKNINAEMIESGHAVPYEIK